MCVLSESVKRDPCDVRVHTVCARGCVRAVCVRRSVGAHSSQAVRSVTVEKRRVKRRAGARRLEPC